jgi:hypothetical protein
MLVDGVNVEYRRPDGSIGGGQVRVLDFDPSQTTGWLSNSSRSSRIAIIVARTSFSS